MNVKPSPSSLLLPLLKGGMLIVTFGACLLALAWAVVLFHSAQEREEEIDRTFRENGTLARTLEEHTRRVLATADQALVFLQTEYQKQGVVTNTMVDYVNRVKQDPVLNQIALAGADGFLVLSAVPHRKPINISDREHFRVHRSSDGVGLFLGKPLITQVSGTWSFFLTRRLSRPDGSFGGIASVGLDPRYFSEYYGVPELGSDKSVVLIGRDGIVRARYFRGKSEVGQDLGKSPLFGAIRQQAAGHYRSVSLIDGLPRLVSYRAMQDYPLIVLVSTVEAGALAPFERRRAAYLAAASLFTLFVLAFSGLLWRAEARSRRQNARLFEELAERKRMEKERLSLERQLQQAQKMESLGLLAGGIAHDFNNLLMGIMGNLDLALAKQEPDSPMRRYLQRAEKAAQRAAELTNQMLAYSGKGRFLVERIDLSRLLGEMRPLLDTVISKRAVVRERLAEGLPPVDADSTQIRQVLMNLITNASDAVAGGDGVITLTTGVVRVDVSHPASEDLREPLSEGMYAFVEVSDNGCGMSPETKARIFDPFFTTKEKGRGLGLAAVLGIVRGHGGGIEIASGVGRGTTFRVLLPVAERGKGEATVVPPGEPGGEEDGWKGQGTVLLVDDEEVVRSTARGMLEECGFQVVTASDGVEALEVFRARAGEFAAVVLDLTMPRLGGEETLREIRRLDPAVPVLLSSGYAEDEPAGLREGGGFAGFVQKPYRLSTLAAKIRDVLAVRRLDKG